MNKLTTKQIEFLNKCLKANKFYSGEWKLDDYGRVMIYGDFDCGNMGLINFLGLKFKYVYGNFDCSYNQLESLEGAPEIIDGDFNCSNNRLKNLLSGPRIVKGCYICSDNELQSLEGVADSINENLDISNNRLESLDVLPEKFGMISF